MVRETSPIQGRSQSEAYDSNFRCKNNGLRGEMGRERPWKFAAHDLEGRGRQQESWISRSGTASNGPGPPEYLITQNLTLNRFGRIIASYT